MTEQSPCAVVEAVREMLLERSKVGVNKYGTTLGGNQASERERLQHALEEALDLSNYLMWRIMQIDAEKGSQAPQDLIVTDQGEERVDSYLNVGRIMQIDCASEQVACEDIKVDTQTDEEKDGWEKVGKAGWRKGSVLIQKIWQPFNLKDMYIVSKEGQSRYADQESEAFKIGNRMI